MEKGWQSVCSLRYSPYADITWCLHVGGEVNISVRPAGVGGALLFATVAAPTASAAEGKAPMGGAPIATVNIQGITVDKQASDTTKRIVAADAEVAATAANVCGTGYTISVSVARYGTYGTTYTWTNGKTTGSGYSYMKVGTKVVIDNYPGVGACN